MASSQELHFIRARCSIDISFWSTITDKILNEWKSSSDNQRVYGFYEFSREKTPRIHFSSSSLSSDSSNRAGLRWTLKGTLKILPNAKSWECFDALESLRACAEQIWLSIENERFLVDPQLLSQFVLVVYPDVKRYQFQYWFGLPAVTPKLKILRLSSQHVNVQTVGAAIRCYLSKSANGFFASRIESDNETNIMELAAVRSPDDIIFSMVDPTSEETFPSWLLRNYITAVVAKFGSGCYSFLCIKSLDPFVARIERVLIDDTVCLSTPRPNPIGWELNVNSKPGPRFVDLGSVMSPESLSTSSVNLNLRLMKWREFPVLDLEMLNSLKVLILGAGTLGCDVARNLAAWGVCNFTFIDNGTVAFSNPTRQSLYNFEDCLIGTKKKALAAAEAMKRISPSISAKGYPSTIAMVGHPLGESMIEQAKKDFHLLQDCIDDSDIVFLLTDSRESRWLPTVICSAKNKPLVNCALGFDTFLVMRHGNQSETDREKLGCYFCADVSAPGDSISDRTLDQQCTVTRPGVGSIASALAVELAVSWMHHPDAEATPTGTSFSLSYDRQNSLGFIPQQLRGWLAQFHIAIIKGIAYPSCIACSETVIKQYNEHGWEFIQDVVNDPLRLEAICGISELKNAVEDLDSESESAESGSPMESH